MALFTPLETFARSWPTNCAKYVIKELKGADKPASGAVLGISPGWTAMRSLMSAGRAVVSFAKAPVARVPTSVPVEPYSE